MEKALKLKVKLPVNIKVGDSWGTLQDYIPPDSTDDWCVLGMLHKTQIGLELVLS